MKKIITLCLTLLLCLSCVFPALADVPAVASEGDDGVMPCVEEFRWYYREIDGRWQKRQWSITRGVWVTDWIDCVV